MNAKRDLLEFCQYILDQHEIDTREAQDLALKLVDKHVRSK